MSYSDLTPPFVPYPNDLDTMGSWPQFQIANDQSESNDQFDHTPPFKRPRSSDDIQPMSHRSPPGNLPVNQPIGKIFFKTRLCAKFRMGQCRNGENCNFAHGEEDLRKPPPNWQELVAGRSEDRGSNGNWEDDEKIIHRMKLCKKFYIGEECPYGDRCNFLHKEPAKFRDNNINSNNSSSNNNNNNNTNNNNNNNNLARIRDGSRESSAISIGTTGPYMVPVSTPEEYDVMKMGNGGMDASRGNVRPVYWKTKLCTKFEVTGHCPFGDKCHFAHGLAGGGRPGEVEPIIVGSTPPKSMPILPNEPVQVKVETMAPSSQEGQGKKCFLKWKGTKKINRIYGDWIDDLPLNLPNEVES